MDDCANYHLRDVLSFLGKAKVEAGETMASMKFRFESDPRWKVIINTEIEIDE